MALLPQNLLLVRVLLCQSATNSRLNFQCVHRNGWLTDVCPVKVVENIVNNLSIVDMMLYGATSSTNYKIMHEAVCMRFVHALKLFRLHPNDFAHILHMHCAIVSGSFALHIFDRSGAWSPKDLDLYVPFHRVNHIVNRLRAHGYIPVGPPHKGNSRITYRHTIASVTKLTNGNHFINIVESSTHSSISPVFQFHLTVVMNYISSSRFFSAYPTLTTQRQSMINHIHYKDNSPMYEWACCMLRQIHFTRI